MIDLTHLMKKTFVILFVSFPFILLAQNADIELLKHINLNRNKDFDGFFRALTHTAGPVAFSIPLLLLGFSFVKKLKSLKQKSFYLIFSVLTAVIITTVLKHTINRPRPFETYSFIEKVTSGGSPSFPSGHTTDAFVIASALSIAFPRWYVIVPSFLWATAIAYSRMGLGVHYPVDVLFGILIGSGSAILWYFIRKKQLIKE
jgi:membrane-associated phospholipid phosphatase